MTTCLDTIKTAMRRLQVLRAGKEPNAAEAVEGLDALQSLYRSWVANGNFGRFRDVITSVAYTAEEFDRIRKDAAVTITIPTTIEDEATGESRAPRDLAVIQVIGPTTGARATYIYEPDQMAWVDIEALETTDAAPLAVRDPSGLAACLALEIAPNHNIEPPAAVVARAGLFLSALSRKPAAPERPVEYTYF